MIPLRRVATREAEISSNPAPYHQRRDKIFADTTRPGTEQDRKTAHPVIRCVEVVGEVAANVSEATRSSASDIPWAAIAGMRYRPAHADFDLDTDVVRKAATEELAAL